MIGFWVASDHEKYEQCSITIVIFDGMFAIIVFKYLSRPKQHVV